MSVFNDAWDNYWQAGFTTSCYSGGQEGYPLAIKEFWNREVFRLLKDGYKVIDLCSGGGGVPDLLIRHATKNNISLNIKVTDLATITQNQESTEKITLDYFPKCNCEDLPFDDSSFDLITSSFGIEYSNLKLTFQEIFRTLKKGGVCATILHCYDSVIVKNSYSQLKQSHYLVHEINFFGLFRDIYLARSRSSVIQKSKEKKLLKCLNKIKLELLHNNELTVYQLILNAAHDIFLYGQSNKPMKCVENINKMERALIYNYRRMENLESAVLSKKQIQEMVEQLNYLGFKVLHNHKIKSEEGKVLGLGFIYKK